MNQTISPDTTRLYLVRHGATDANMKRPYILQGRSIDMSLNSAGRQQAGAVADFLSSHPVSRVYSSCMKRAVETGRMIADKQTLAAKRTVVTDVISGLHECDVGEWEGMDWESIMHAHPEDYRAFIEDPASIPYLGGESYGDVLRRARPIIGNLLLRHRGESIVIVAHNVVNRVYLADLMGLDLRKAKDLRQSNCCVNVIEYRAGETQLMTMNAAFHL